MKTILVDKNTNEVIIYTVKTDLCKRLNISSVTLWNWSKDKIKETKGFIVYFEAVEYKNKSLRRKYAEMNLKPNTGK